MGKNPYLKPGRLTDVIAAITVLGNYKFYKLDAGGWAMRISGGGKSAQHWGEVFDEHPEFFRRATVGQNKFSLVWRRQFPRNFDVDAEAEHLPDHEIDGTSESRISRRPLNPSEITALIGVAVELHQAALNQSNSRRWWIPIAAAVLGFAGAVSGALLSTSSVSDTHCDPVATGAEAARAFAIAPAMNLTCEDASARP